MKNRLRHTGPPAARLPDGQARRGGQGGAGTEKIKHNQPKPRRRGWQKHRVLFRVERFPEPVRALVDRGLAQGKSYRAIQQQVVAAGETITHHAIGRYWRYRWQPQTRWLHWINAQADALAQALRHTGESDEAVLARKLLIGQLLSRMEGAIKKMEFPDLLAESREMVKATRHLDSKPSRRPALSPEQVQREVREIYGWTQEELEPESPKPAPEASGQPSGSGKAES